MVIEVDLIKNTIKKNNSNKSYKINKLYLIDQQLKKMIKLRKEKNNLSLEEFKDSLEVLNIIRVVRKSKKTTEPISPPKKCPVCGGNTFKEVNEAVLRCQNTYGCYAQRISQIIHFVGKKALNIDGFGEKQVKQFYDLKLIEDVSDIFNIQNHKLEIESLEGWGELSFNNLVNSIEKSKTINLDKLI